MFGGPRSKFASSRALSCSRGFPPHRVGDQRSRAHSQQTEFRRRRLLDYAMPHGIEAEDGPLTAAFAQFENACPAAQAGGGKGVLCRSPGGAGLRSGCVRGHPLRVRAEPGHTLAPGVPASGRKMLSRRGNHLILARSFARHDEVCAGRRHQPCKSARPRFRFVASNSCGLGSQTRRDAGP